MLWIIVCAQGADKCDYTHVNMAKRTQDKQSAERLSPFNAMHTSHKPALPISSWVHPSMASRGQSGQQIHVTLLKIQFINKRELNGT